jgi:hypothetical protein
LEFLFILVELNNSNKLSPQLTYSSLEHASKPLFFFLDATHHHIGTAQSSSFAILSAAAD